MAAFKDRLSRNIEIVTDDYEATASHAGRKVGEVVTSGIREMDKIDDLPAKITGMFVDPSYQGAGIGLALLDALSDELGMLAPADKNVGRGGENALTDAGLRLTRRAQAAGYVYPFEDEVPLRTTSESARPSQF